MVKKLWKIVRYPLLMVTVLILGLLMYMTIGKGSTPAFKDSKGDVIPESVASLETIQLGGVDQTILIRGTNKNNPVLLWLHGGPGWAEMRIRSWQEELEKHFVVVNWDQRGSGKSYSDKIDAASLSEQQYFSDAEELVNILRDRFHQDKIYVAGHSWGSVIGTHLVQQHPEQYYAYIGVGQVVDLVEGLKLSHDWVLDSATRAGNQQAVDELKQQGEIVSNDPTVLNQQWTGTLKWVAEFGGSEYHNATVKTIATIVSNPEYSLSDFKKFNNGLSLTLRGKVMDELWGVHLDQQIPEYKVPVYFLQGKHDYHTPYALVERYYDHIKAPSKKLIPFEESAHNPHLEDTDAFNEAIISTILPETYK